MKVYNKLVRDLIPEIIEKTGKECIVRTLNEKEFKQALHAKVLEESHELMRASTRGEIIDELGDLYEVIEMIMIVNRIDKRDIDNHRIKKNMIKGSFDQRIYLEKVK